MIDTTNNNIINENTADIETLTSFEGFFDNRYIDPHVNGYSFLFVVKPQLFINPIRPTDTTDYNANLAYENMTIEPEFSMFLTKDGANTSDIAIAKELSYLKFNDITSSFLPIFTNRVKSVPTFDKVLDTMTAYETKQSYKMVLPSIDTASTSSGTLDLNIDETANLDIMKITELWVKYMTNISDGTFNANPEMIKNCTLDYATSIFYFILAPDGETIKYWSKYTGCYPTNVPYSKLSYNKGEETVADSDVSFVYMIKEDMNPQILEDFNKISFNISGHYEDNSSLATEIGGRSYTNGVSSPLLSKKLLLSDSTLLAKINNTNRDPIVFYDDIQKNGHFKLSFGASMGKNNFAEEKFKNNYYYGTDSDFISDITKDK